MSNLFWLTEAQMARLEPFFPKSHGKPRVDDRPVLSDIIFINHNGLCKRKVELSHLSKVRMSPCPSGMGVDFHLELSRLSA